ncbi:hypothetical protein CoNPh26_CDS0080 [Staphylococcus phage S-CoN_Ph26]|nr:hypothetical protein CoNPh26_CDS0080 [Staphylococcus phage S-CoN_Ph26]
MFSLCLFFIRPFYFEKKRKIIFCSNFSFANIFCSVKNLFFS